MNLSLSLGNFLAYTTPIIFEVILVYESCTCCTRLQETAIFPKLKITYCTAILLLRSTKIIHT